MSKHVCADICESIIRPCVIIVKHLYLNGHKHAHVFFIREAYKFVHFLPLLDFSLLSIEHSLLISQRLIMQEHLLQPRMVILFNFGKLVKMKFGTIKRGTIKVSKHPKDSLDFHFCSICRSIDIDQWKNTPGNTAHENLFNHM